jgi:MoxR-like ATPase
MDVQSIIERYRAEMGKRIVGQESMVDGFLMALVVGGHVLLEGVPGLAKTLAIKTLVGVTGLSFKRIQFTPDLLPADLTGTLVWEASSSTFSMRRGPLFANIVLADEVNRAPAKVQSALLEAMEEHQVTLGEESHRLPDPFFVLATQNPIEQEGTYPLPEAELDRFLLKLKVNYPSFENEMRIVTGNLSEVEILPILDMHILQKLRETAERVFVDEKIVSYIVSIVQATRVDKKEKKRAEGIYRYISYGASVRGSVAIYKCARVRALFDGRDFVTPDDVKKVVPDALRHRLVLSYEAEAESVDADSVLTRILTYVKVP